MMISVKQLPLITRTFLNFLAKRCREFCFVHESYMEINIKKKINIFFTKQCKKRLLLDDLYVFRLNLKELMFTGTMFEILGAEFAIDCIV